MKDTTFWLVFGWCFQLFSDIKYIQPFYGLYLSTSNDKSCRHVQRRIFPLNPGNKYIRKLSFRTVVSVMAEEWYFGEDNNTEAHAFDLTTLVGVFLLNYNNYEGWRVLKQLFKFWKKRGLPKLLTLVFLFRQFF